MSFKIQLYPTGEQSERIELQQGVLKPLLALLYI